MNYQTTDTYRYLIFLEKYLLGDLEKFHRLCDGAELEENESVNSVNTSQQEGVTTTTTTMNPYSFDFMIGKPIISRSTIPHTASLFATIDVLGFLIRSGNDYRGTKNNFAAFFNYLNHQLSPAELSVLVNVFRHGMTHGFFPVLNMEISCHSSNPIEKMFLKTSSGGLVLNVNHLLSVVPRRLRQIIDDESLYSDMEMKFNFLSQIYESNCRNDINDVLSQL